MRNFTIFLCLIMGQFFNANGQNSKGEVQDTVSITYISNAGFLVEMANKKIVFDGFFTEGFDKYDCPREDIIIQMKKSLPPFQNIDYIFVSHYHADHINSSLVMEYLINNKQTKLFCPNQVNCLLQEDSLRYKTIKDQIVLMTPKENSFKKLDFEDVSVTACRFWHGKKENKDIENIGFILEYKDKRIFHTGDATLADFNGINGYIAKCNISVAIVHNSFGSIKLLHKTHRLIHADNYIFMHLPREYAHMFHTFFTKNPEVIPNPYVFRETMEKKTYLIHKD